MPRQPIVSFLLFRYNLIILCIAIDLHMPIFSCITSIAAEVTGNFGSLVVGRGARLAACGELICGTKNKYHDQCKS